jgi:integrase
VTFFNVMLKGSPNPTRDAVRVKEPKLEARGRDMRIIQAAIDAMPEYAKATIPRLSLAKVRARVIAWTGIPPGMLGQLRPHDFDLVHGTVRTPPREKGDGVEARTLNLTPEGLEAVRVFHQANAYGRFPSKTVNDAVKSAARKVGVDPKTIRLYDLRHSFLSQMYRATKDQATVGRFALHAPGSRLTARYTEAANEAVDRAAVVAFTESLAPTSGTVAVPKVARKVARRRKSKQTLKLAQG